jgi:hydroxymethylbilane synthase
MRQFTVGTRGSALALWQTRHVTSLLAPHGAQVTERVITTQGDINLTERLQGKIEKGFFTQELEAALHEQQIDWAVHSLKDLPTRLPAGLVLGAVLERAPAADLLLIHPSAFQEGALLSLKLGARVGSSSLRRESLLRHYAPECLPVPLRGNVPTRVEKLRSGQFDAILLAEAGISRLQLDLAGLVVLRLNPRRWVCAPGQGAVAVQCREGDAEVRTLLTRLDHAATHRATQLERDFLRVLEGGCTTPFGCFIEGDGRAHLGLATATGWHASHVALAAEPTPPWLQTQLDQLTQQPNQEMTDEWLTRRV